MRVKLTEPILDFENRAILEAGVPLTYRGVFYTALTGRRADEALPLAEEKAAAFALGLKLFSAAEVDLTADEIVMLKKRVDAVYPSPLICGRVSQFFEEKSSSED